MNILPDGLNHVVTQVTQLLALFLVLLLFVLLLLGVVFWVVDRFQTRHAVRRNYPLIGRFRYLFEHLGEFFRQYFFAMDQEELPFNRAQRVWVYRAAKNLDDTVAFGSTKDIWRVGSVIFLNHPYPAMGGEVAEPEAMTIGPHCETPFTTSAFFHISAMSFGAISRPAVKALSLGAAQAGCWLNTGEGGLSPYHLTGGCDLVFQIGTAKYGVRDPDGSLSEQRLEEIASHPQVRMFEIKMSQGAKPGKGGILPAAKVTEEIAAIRGIPAGQASISPNGHPEFHGEEDILDMVERIRKITGKPVGIKAVIGTVEWLDDLMHAIGRRGSESAPDFITVDGGDGGTGAAPQALMDDVGLPLRESLPLVVDKLTEYGLKSRVKVIASGKLLNPVNGAWALCLGADFVASARGFMFALGCIQAMRCNRNTCPTGITTHDPRLQRGLVPEDKAQRVAHYHHNMEQAIGVIAHSCGVSEPRELRRHHARMVTEAGRSAQLDEIYPYASQGRK